MAFDGVLQCPPFGMINQYQAIPNKATIYSLTLGTESLLHKTVGTLAGLCDGFGGLRLTPPLTYWLKCQ